MVKKRDDHTDFLCVGTVCCVLIIVIIISKISTFVLIADVDRKIQDFVVTEGGIICQLSQKILDAVIVKIRKIPKRGQPREVLPNCRQFFPGRFLSPL